MDIALRRLAIVASLLTSAVCSGSNTNPTPPPLTGSVTDLTGDTVIFPVLRDGVLMTPVVPIPPDLVAATIDVTGGNLTATIAFAPGTFSHTDTFACLMLDVDESVATGNPSPGGDVPLGYDYSVGCRIWRGPPVLCARSAACVHRRDFESERPYFNSGVDDPLMP